MINTMLKEPELTLNNPVVICQSDLAILKRLSAMQGWSTSAIPTLKAELDRAIVVKDEAFPTNTIRLNSTVDVLNLETGKPATYKIVLPESANINQRKISVLTPMATALIGFREGDLVRCKMPGSIVNLKISRVSN